jgi:hypothetical protein
VCYHFRHKDIYILSGAVWTFTPLVFLALVVNVLMSGPEPYVPGKIRIRIALAVLSFLAAMVCTLFLLAAYLEKGAAVGDLEAFVPIALVAIAGCLVSQEWEAWIKTSRGKSDNPTMSH